MVKDLKVCQGPVCSAKGSKNLLASIGDDLKVGPGECTEEYCLGVCVCTGNCERAINIRVDDKIVQEVLASNWREKVANPEEIKKTVGSLDDNFLNDI